MKYFSLCIDCSEENPESMIWAEGEITSDLVAMCICNKGHKSVSGLAHNLFDVLYSSAVDAFIKGCFSESVMSFAASLERTYEMFIKVTMIKEGISLTEIEEFWKEIKNQSERQYGAFCLQYVKVSGEVWRFDTNKVKFRNDVVHKGYVATSNEVKNYADYTTECQFKILKKLHVDFSNESREFYFYHKELEGRAAEKLMKEHNAKFSATSMPSLLKWNFSEIEDVSFHNALETMKELNKKFRG